MSEGEKRPWNEVLPKAMYIIEALRPYCERVELAGSLRRGRPRVGDIEICAIPIRPKSLLGESLEGQPTGLDMFLADKLKDGGLIKNGSKYKQFRYGPFTVDLFLPTAETWGSIFFIRTGSHEWNLWVMRTAAPRAGVKFQGGLLYDSTWNVIPAPEEAAVFEALGLPFVPPELRDDGKWLEMVNHDRAKS